MPEMSQAASVPDRPPLRLKGTHLAIASPDSISEACFSVPAVRAIRTARPQSTIIMVANETTAPIWRKVMEVNCVIEHHSSDSPRKISRFLGESEIPFDSSIAWEDSSAAQSFANYGIRQRLGYPAGKLCKFLTDAVEVVRKIGPIEHQVNHYLLFIEKLGAEPFAPTNFSPPPRPKAAPNFRIAIAPGSDFGTAAEWSIDRFINFSDDVSEHCDIAILPSPNRTEPAADLAKALGKPVTNLASDDLIDFLATCSGLVSNDGSIPHLASLVGTPSLVLFGPNEPDWRRPLGRIHRVIRRHVPCSACLLNKCPLDHRCLHEITAEEVLNELRELFAGVEPT